MQRDGIIHVQEVVNLLFQIESKASTSVTRIESTLDYQKQKKRFEIDDEPPTTREQSNMTQSYKFIFK